MRLTFLGEPLDASREHNLIQTGETPYGFRVSVVFKKESIFSRKVHGGKLKIEFNNCHRVHSMYYSAVRQDEPRIAFESNTHSIGGTYGIDDLESVTIEKALFRSDKF